MGNVFYKPEDTYYIRLDLIPSTYYGDSCQILTRTLLYHGININFQSGYINYRLGYTNDPNNPYTYTLLNTDLNYNGVYYWRENLNQLYNTSNIEQGTGNHTFTYEVVSSDVSYNYYKIYTDQFIEVRDDDGQGGGGAWQAYYESTDCLAVPTDTSSYDIIGYINSYVVKGKFAAKVHGTYYYASLVNSESKVISRQRVDNNIMIVNNEVVIVGVAYSPSFLYYSTKNIVQPNGNEDWYVHYAIDYWSQPDEDSYVSGHLEPTTPVPGSVNEHNELRNYYPISGWSDDSTYPYALSAYVWNDFVILVKTEYGYSAGGGFVQLTLADGYPDNKVHWQYRYIDQDGKIRWYTSVESFNITQNNDIDYATGVINPISATWYGPVDMRLGIPTLTNV